MEMLKVKKLTKEERGSVARMIAKIRAEEKIARTLYEYGLTSYYSTGNSVIYIKSMDDLPSVIKKLHALFPDIKRIGEPSTWSPYADVAMIAWNYKVGDINVNIWYETKIDNVPILSDKCKYVKYTTESYRLECEA